MESLNWNVPWLLSLRARLGPGSAVSKYLALWSRGSLGALLCPALFRGRIVGYS